MNEDQRNQEQHNDFTAKKSLGSRKGMIALLFILIVLMLYGFLHSALKSDKKEDPNEPQTKVVRDIKSETNKADYGEQNKRLQEEHKELQYQKVETPTVDPVAAEEAKAAAAAAANAAKEAQAAAAKAAAAEEAAASSAIKFNINSNSSNNDKPANQGKSGYIQVIQ